VRVDVEAEVAVRVGVFVEEPGVLVLLGVFDAPPLCVVGVIVQVAVRVAVATTAPDVSVVGEGSDVSVGTAAATDVSSVGSTTGGSVGSWAGGSWAGGS
jgi:hypothetical protein